MGKEIDWGAQGHSVHFILIVRVVHIKYRDGEGKNWGREMVEYTLHSTLISFMDREPFKYRIDGWVRDRLRIWDERTQTIRPERNRETEGRGGTSENGGPKWPGWCTADDKLNGALISPVLFTSLHLSQPFFPFLCSLYPSFSGYYSNYVCLKETDHSAQSLC